MRLGVRAYRTPFLKALATARGAWTHREGLWIAVADAEGHVGVGEAAPLPAWGTEGLDEALAALVAAARHGGPLAPEAAAWGMDPLATPAAWAGLELALLDLMGQRRGVPLAQALKADWAAHEQLIAATDPLSPEGDPAGESVVPVNALLTGTGPEALAEEARLAVAAGYRAVKLKVGGRAIEMDVERARAVREAIGPDVGLRLDGNGGWSREEAARALMALAAFAPDYVEQPVASDDLDGLIAVGRETDVTVAADEAAGSLAGARRCLEAGVPVLVLKPMALGGLSATAAIARSARGTRLVLTSALDRGVGTAGVLHLAAALGLREPSGLATGSLYAAPALAGLEVRSGALAVPTGPGLGLAVADPELLALMKEVRDAALAHA